MYKRGCKMMKNTKDKKRIESENLEELEAELEKLELEEKKAIVRYIG